MGKKSDACDSTAKGECPTDFQVPKGCCKDANVRHFLDVKNTHFVCCNTPCTDTANISGCALPSHCQEKPVPIPNARSFGGGYSPYSYDPTNYGFSPYVMPPSYPYRYGKQYNTGMQMGYGGYNMGSSSAEPSSKVEEITVDDVIEALTQALTNDKDVFESSHQIDADPLFGKSKTGGTLGDFNLLDPDFFIRQMYQGADPNVIRMQIAGQGYGFGGGMGYGSGRPYAYGGNYGYGGNQGYEGNHGYSGSQGHGGNQGYGGSQGYGVNQGYGGNQGYGVNQGYGGNHGYGGNEGYGGNHGYGGSQSYGSGNKEYGPQQYGGTYGSYNQGYS